jgi:hypothetical protein
MAYAASGLSLVAHGGGNSIFIYRSTDTVVEVLASGYFNSAALQMQAGDEIIVYARSSGSNPTSFRLRVRTASSTAVAVETPNAVMSIVVPVAVTAVASTALTATLPPCTIIRASSYTTTAFTGNTVTMAIGTAAAGEQIVAATTIKAAGVFSHTLVAAGIAFAGGTVHLTVAQTATETAVGAARTVIEFVPT